MIAITILALIITFASSIYFNFFGTVRNLKAANLVYEEARFTMERIVKEVRNGTIDYEEYFNQTLVKDRVGSSYDYIPNDTYAQDYCQYSRQFYDIGPDEEIGTLDDESIGERVENDPVTGLPVPPSLGRWEGGEFVADPIQNNLYLINIDGNKRTYLKRIETYDANGNPIGKVGLLKMTGEDFGVDHINSLDPDLDPSSNETCSSDSGENDGRIDTWICDDGYSCDEVILSAGDCSNAVAGNIIYGQNIIINPATAGKNSFVDITPASLDVVDLKFIISPMDDPRKAYNDDSVQVQPHVTIKMIVRANPKLSAQFKSGNSPDISLESTISTRAQNEIITECNLRQCIDGVSPPKSCPLSTGVCGPNPSSPTPSDSPATQECSNFVWGGCGETDYRDYAEDEWALFYAGVILGDGYAYQSGSEFASCDPDDIGCVTSFCTDNMDNDCDGLEDEMDPECRYFLCNDGLYNIDVEGADGCRDVGGLCQTIRPLEPIETTCYDGYDNDCNYEAGVDGTGADQFDSNCIEQLCSNGKMDPDGKTVPNTNIPPVPFFLKETYTPKDYLLGAIDTDTDASLAETCIDVGPLCPTKALSPGAKETDSCGTTECERIVCSDGYDNDCDGQADELDDDCISVICNDTKKNCDLIDTGYDFVGDPNISEDYLKNYFNISCGNTDLDEACVNVGGLCTGYRNDPPGAVYADHTLLISENTPILASSDEIKANPEDLCRDNLDNDCDGNFDWQDTDCCPDSDGDGYIGENFGGTNYCFIDDAKADGALIDCNDAENGIRPGATEICDGATYAMDYPLVTLRGKPIDNNCSYANGLTVNESDETDPQCCIDTDGDGYGVQDAYLSCTYKSAPDCDDGNALIMPGGVESNCMNTDGVYPVNDTCAYDEITYGSVTTTVPQANHIDWYADKNATWFENYGDAEGFDTSGLSGEIGIEAAYLLHLYQNQCCNFSAIEICDDNSYGSYGSDENCNGLEGFNDNYCVTDDRSVYYEYFKAVGHGLILETINGVIQNINPGEITLSSPTDHGTVQSGTLSFLDLSACTSSYQITISGNESIPGGSDIDYQISSDGGSNWCNASNCTGVDWIESLPATVTVNTSADPTATNVRWQALLSGNDSTSSIPTLSDITITISNCN
ncbi:hypothetical protein JW758_04520 [Candidatus Peregrinibacteria bacterium]|nr:hypothetical protein [Candidatus Peregrinibacteria bacterium]